MLKTGLIVGSGRQSEALVNLLSSTNEYHLLVFTRSKTSTTSLRLAALANVEIVVNSAGHGYDLDALLAAASRSDFVFVNTDGFELGEQAETYWGIRLFELSRKANVKHLIYSGLDYASRDSGFDPSLYVGHYEGKARVQQFIHSQPKSPMAWTIIRSGPYIENLWQLMAPTINASGTYVFKLPLGNGAIPFIYLNDLAGYTHWALSNLEQSNGLDLGVATVHASGADIANALTDVTAKPAQYVDLPIEEWQVATWKKLPKGPDTKVGSLSVKDDGALLQTYGENFTNWWNLYKASAGNKGLIQRDYEFLDKILPTRVKGVADWMRVANYTGERLSTLKILD
ncbi:hypothetical protein BGZ61DRAFT_337029 [Ilyonectria robusta]|uniref:uncharacterized protein n=1 Tax=Ilyonectria robusta TaxID=1079257 RepID=UPI001E8E2C66|nr:uncharacterized protein BGZ61DRAFT_337029 [Ilyonectria robusta]KAH8738378.1 hypothetical protein BGZ61DRAFT_337029 [Ilyonectria robusta]